jgi:hypothetical protein
MQENADHVEGCSTCFGTFSHVLPLLRPCAFAQLPCSHGAIIYVPRRDVNAGTAELSDPRFSTGLPALDCVLGGGLVKGSTTLLVGSPGTGKTTLTLQLLKWW